MNFKNLVYCLFAFCVSLKLHSGQVSAPLPEKGMGLPLYYWCEEVSFTNFGDYLSVKIVERIVGGHLRVLPKNFSKTDKKFLALGSILSFARNGDVIWGTGVNGKVLDRKRYLFDTLDVRAVRGPLTKGFLENVLHIPCPDVFGDPALLFPYLFPEFKRKKSPKYPYIVIPHFTEEKMFPKSLGDHIVYPTEPWDQVIEKILDSEFVISSSLHGIILAESYGIPARWLRVSEGEPILKYLDYFQGTGRTHSVPAYSIEEACQMGGEKEPCVCDLQALYSAFPFELWGDIPFYRPKL